MRVCSIARCAAILAAGPLLATAQGFPVHPDTLDFNMPASDTPVLPPQLVVVNSFTIPFEWTVASGYPNFVTMSPSSGVGTTSIVVSLNPAVVPYLGPGKYSMLAIFSSTDPARPLSGLLSINLRIPQPKPPVITNIVNSASQQAALTGGTLVSIYGTNLGTPAASPVSSYSIPVGGGSLTIARQPLSFDSLAYDFSSTLTGGTVVSFGSVPAPLLYVSPTQINAVVPYGTFVSDLPVVVSHNRQVSPPFQVSFASSAPGIFTVAPDGHGPGAIQNVDPQTGAVTLNTAANPAPKGSAIVLYGTGAGQWSQYAPNGTIIKDVLTPPYYRLAASLFRPVALTIGGQQAKMLYAGAAPNQVFGMFQVNAIVPDGIGSGPQPVVLSIEDHDNSQQQVTVFVK